MNWRTTLWLIGAALAAVLFVLAVERPARLARTRAGALRQIVPGFVPASVHTIQVRSTNGTVELVRTNGLWAIRDTERRLAHQAVAEGLLNRVAELRGRSILSTTELRDRPGAATDFGLSPPAATVTFESPSGRTELLLGIRSLNGAQVYYQVPGVPGIYAAPAELLDLLPQTPAGWRDTTLLPLDRLTFDRIRVAAAGGAFALARDATNGVWEMIEPRAARADSVRVGVLLRQLGLIQISRFLSSTAAPAPEVAGLRPPQISLSLGRGSNEVYSLALGSLVTNLAEPAPASTNAPGATATTASVYAQRPGEPDTLAVPAEAQELLKVSYKDLLDRRLVRFDRAAVREVEFAGPENFLLTWRDDAWHLSPSGLRADPQLVERLFNHLAMLEMIDIAKEVVTDLDLANYGLAPPAGRITLRARPGDTNSVLARLETGALRDNHRFARVPGEQPVYLVSPGDLDEIPSLTWALRDRSLWRFDAPQIASVTARYDGTEWTVRRQGTNDWSVPPGARNEVNPFALDEALHRLGEARILAWRGLGEARATSLGVGRGPELVVEFRGQPAPPPLKLRFGKGAPGGRRYATLTLADGTQPVFELPGILFDEVWRESGMAGQISKPPQ